jgi:hypothetical protein
MQSSWEQSGQGRKEGTNCSVQNSLKKMATAEQLASSKQFKKLATAEQLEQNGPGNSSKKLARAE